MSEQSREETQGHEAPWKGQAKRHVGVAPGVGRTKATGSQQGRLGSVAEGEGRSRGQALTPVRCVVRTRSSTSACRSLLRQGPAWHGPRHTVTFRAAAVGGGSLVRTAASRS